MIHDVNHEKKALMIHNEVCRSNRIHSKILDIAQKSNQHTIEECG